jgi:hypothetical protein|tara:strand:- start:519 stop:776 length:258 start_codon:yes stop_codon:yes gene_type:complete
MSAPKLAKPLAESDLTSVLGIISAAKVKGSAIAARDYVMDRQNIHNSTQGLRVALEGVAARSVLSELADPTADLGSGLALLLSRR